MVFYYNLLYNRIKIGARGDILKMNNKGFMLAETLVVSVFVLTVFSMLYSNLLPIIAEYSKYRNYNTVEATYNAHWARKIVLDGLNDASYATTINNGYLDITNCALYTKNDMEEWCNRYKDVNNISKIYLTTYNTTRFKNYAKSTNLLARDFKDYISYIPTYSKNTTKTSNNNYFHVIIEKNKGSVHNYGIMEVYRK